jgi:hypothetical protein
MFDTVKDWFVTNLEWVVVQRILGVLFMTTLATVILDRAFGLLSVWRQKIWFFLGVLVIGIITIQYLPSGQSHLKSAIIYLLVYPVPPPTVFSLIGIANDGPTQTSVTNIYLSTVVDGRTYIGKPIEMPEKVPISIGNVVTTYYGKDSLLNKLIDPIPLGSARNGPVIFIFTDATHNILNKPGTYMLHFKDIAGKDYQSSTETFANPQPPAFGVPGIQRDVNVITSPATTQGAPKN